MTIQRRFAPISGRFEPELLAGLAGIYTWCARDVENNELLLLQELFIKKQTVPHKVISPRI